VNWVIRRIAASQNPHLQALTQIPANPAKNCYDKQQFDVCVCGTTNVAAVK